MIHLDYADGTSEWLTDEQLKEKHPELYAKLRQPEPYREHGQKLKAIRQQNDYSIRELAKMLKVKGSDVCDIEQGRVMPSQDTVDFYGRLQHRTAAE
jgi:ribosome-binding protein aMBF1 (putative translation factor)